MSEPQNPASADLNARPAEHGAAGFENVLVGVDGRSAGRDAIALAGALCSHDGRLTLAHVTVGAAGAGLGFDPDASREEALELAGREGAAMGASGAELAGVAALSVGRGLHALVKRADADLLVVGSCRRGLLGRVLIGDDTRAAMTGSSCAVAIAPHGYAQRSRPIRVIGVGYDDTPGARAALALAQQIAAEREATVRVLMVVNLPTAEVSYWEVMAAGTEEALARLTALAQARLDALDGVDGRVVVGEASEELAHFGEEIDLLVVGSRGYGPVRRLILGSTSHRLAHSSRCPLLVLPRSALAHGPLASKPALRSAV